MFVVQTFGAGKCSVYANEWFIGVDFACMHKLSQDGQKGLLQVTRLTGSTCLYSVAVHVIFSALTD